MNDTKTTIHQKLTDIYYYYYDKYLCNDVSFEEWEFFKENIQELRKGLTLFVENKNDKKI